MDVVGHTGSIFISIKLHITQTGDMMDMFHQGHESNISLKHFMCFVVENIS